MKPLMGVATARSMDWKSDIGTNLWILPRGMAQHGEAGPHSIEWVSRYSSVIASAYDVSTFGGVNEKGLVTNPLWLAESEYPKPGATKLVWHCPGGRSTLSTTVQLSRTFKRLHRSNSSDSNHRTAVCLQGRAFRC